MGRTKQYERTELLDQAVELFRRQGFNGTSTAELVEELGVNRKTMYAEFGSKQALFEAALARYDEKHLTRVLARVEAPGAGVADIRRAFTSYAAASEGWFKGRGCLLTNTAVERAALDPASGRHVEAYMARLTRAFRHALGNAMRTGDLRPEADLDELAAFLATTLVGVAACIRAEVPQAQLEATARVVGSVLDAAAPVPTPARAPGRGRARRPGQRA